MHICGGIGYRHFDAIHSAGAPLHRICIPAYTHRIPNGMPGHHIATNIKTTTRGTTPQWNTTTLVGTYLRHVMDASPQHNPQSGGGRKVLRPYGQNSCGSDGWIFVAAVAYLKACIFVAESVTGISMRFTPLALRYIASAYRPTHIASLTGCPGPFPLGR